MGLHREEIPTRVGMYRTRHASQTPLRMKSPRAWGCTVSEDRWKTLRALEIPTRVGMYRGD